MEQKFEFWLSSSGSRKKNYSRPYSHHITHSDKPIFVSVDVSIFGPIVPEKRTHSLSGWSAYFDTEAKSQLFSRRHYQMYFLVRLKFRWHLFLSLELTIFQHWIMSWCRTGDEPLSKTMMAYVADAYMRHSASVNQLILIESLCMWQMKPQVEFPSAFVTQFNVKNYNN